VRQFCSYQSKSGHSQWTLKPSKMAQTVGKAWSRRPRPQTGGAQPPVLLRLSPVRSSSRAITAPFAGCRRFSPQCWCIRKNRDSSAAMTGITLRHLRAAQGTRDPARLRRDWSWPNIPSGGLHALRGGHPKPSPAPATPLEGLIGIAAPGCGDEVESRRDRLGHAILGGPFSPGAIERDSVRVGGSALGRASTRGRPAVRV
jgi:hypothetical protein